MKIFLMIFRFVIILILTYKFFTIKALAQWSNDPNVNNAICIAAINEERPTIVSDGAGGAIITWQDLRNGYNYDIYAQRINASGVVQWTVNGVAICSALNDQLYPTIISDGAGGAIITWQDHRSGSNLDIYASRVFHDGELPIQLASFTAQMNRANDGVLLKWTTITEIKNYGFQIERRTIGEQLPTWNNITFVKGFGTSNSPKQYEYIDQNLIAGKYAYRLKQIDNDGKVTCSESVEVEVLDPKIFSLEQNYPNPFNPSTKIKFAVAALGFVSMKVFNILGQEVSSLLNKEMQPGNYELTWDGTGFQSGVYFYSMTAGGVTSTKSMILIK